MNGLDKAEKDIGYVGGRLREMSTYAGIGNLVGALAIFHFVPATAAPDIVKDIVGIGMGLGGLIAMVLPDPGKWS
jgi:hypothetical protein